MNMVSTSCFPIPKCKAACRDVAHIASIVILTPIVLALSPIALAGGACVGLHLKYKQRKHLKQKKKLEKQLPSTITTDHKEYFILGLVSLTPIWAFVQKDTVLLVPLDNKMLRINDAARCILATLDHHPTKNICFWTGPCTASHIIAAFDECMNLPAQMSLRGFQSDIVTLVTPAAECHATETPVDAKGLYEALALLNVSRGEFVGRFSHLQQTIPHVIVD